VLVVDDEPDIALTMAEYIRSEGYEVVVAEDGIAALRHCQAGPPPSLVITDFMMPRMSGAELVSRLSGDPRFCSIPVVVVSAVPDRALSAGTRPRWLMTKPLDLDDLMPFVARYCRKGPDPLP
jgi:CheY-like chemotaxis protein